MFVLVDVLAARIDKMSVTVPRDSTVPVMQHPTLFYQVSRIGIVLGSVEGTGIVTYEIDPRRVCVALYTLDAVVVMHRRRAA